VNLVANKRVYVYYFHGRGTILNSVPVSLRVDITMITMFLLREITAVYFENRTKHLY
jgi:hypothetical protein